MFHCSSSFRPNVCVHRITYHVHLNWPNHCVFRLRTQSLCSKDLRWIHHKTSTRIFFSHLSVMSLKRFGAAAVWLRTLEQLPNWHIDVAFCKEPIDMLHIEVQNRRNFVTYFLKHKLTETFNSFRNYSDTTICIAFFLDTRSIAINIETNKESSISLVPNRSEFISSVASCYSCKGSAAGELGTASLRECFDVFVDSLYSLMLIYTSFFSSQKVYLLWNCEADAENGTSCSRRLCTTDWCILAPCFAKLKKLSPTLVATEQVNCISSPGYLEEVEICCQNPNLWFARLVLGRSEMSRKMASNTTSLLRIAA